MSSLRPYICSCPSIVAATLASKNVSTIQYFHPWCPYKSLCKSSEIRVPSAAKREGSHHSSDAHSREEQHSYGH